MTEQEIITAAKTNWLAWQGLKELQPEVAAWMEKHKSDCLVFGSIRKFCITHAEVFYAGNVYRLRPDYEPVRWFFYPTKRIVTQSATEPHDDGTDTQPGYYEVTAEYANYLRTPVECYSELRMVKSGDEYIGVFGLSLAAGDDMTDTGPDDRGYRWCKPKVDIAQLRRELVEARARMMDATDAYLDAKHRLDGALRVRK